MTLYGRYIDFTARIGMLQYGAEIEKKYNIRPNSVFGWFEAHRLDELKKICYRNPLLHIAACDRDQNFFNRIIDDSKFLYLADGDRNPDLEYIDQGELLPKIHPLEFARLLLAKMHR